MKKLILFLFLTASVVVYSQPTIMVARPTPAEAGSELIDYLAFYKFDGDLTDEGGNFDATASGVTYQGDTAALFAGSAGNYYIDCGAALPNGIDTFTLSYMVYLNEGTVNENYYGYGNVSAYTSNAGIFSYFDGTGTGYFNQTVRVNASDGTTSYAHTAAGGSCVSQMADDTWYHIVEIMYYGSSSVTYWVMYLDGTFCHTSGSDSTINKVLSITGTDLLLGNEGRLIQGFREGALYNSYMIFEGDLRNLDGANYVDDLIADPYSIPVKE